MKTFLIAICLITASSLYCQNFVAYELFSPEAGLHDAKLCAMPAMGLCKIEGGSIVPLAGDAPTVKLPTGMEVDDVAFIDDRFVFQIGNAIYSYDGDRLLRECSFEGGTVKMSGGAKNNVLLVTQSDSISQLLDFDLDSRILRPIMSSTKEQFIGAFGCDSTHLVATRSDIFMYFGNEIFLPFLQSSEHINAVNVTDYGIFFCTDEALYQLYGDNEALILSTDGFTNILYDGTNIYLTAPDGYIYLLAPE